MTAKFWLAWDPHQKTYVRRCSGETIAELTRQLRRSGRSWSFALRGLRGGWLILHSTQEDGS